MIGISPPPGNQGLVSKKLYCEQALIFLFLNHNRLRACVRGMHKFTFCSTRAALRTRGACSRSTLFQCQLEIERFSFECRKVIGFALSTRCDWLKRFAPPFHPIRSKTKANCDALACIFPRFASATCNYFEF